MNLLDFFTTLEGKDSQTETDLHLSHPKLAQ